MHSTVRMPEYQPFTLRFPLIKLYVPVTAQRPKEQANIAAKPSSVNYHCQNMCPLYY